jgi:hypothetical protein
MRVRWDPGVTIRITVGVVAMERDFLVEVSDQLGLPVEALPLAFDLMLQPLVPLVLPLRGCDGGFNVDRGHGGHGG